MTQTPGIPFRTRNETNNDYQQNPRAWAGESTVIYQAQQENEPSQLSSTDPVRSSGTVNDSDSSDSDSDPTRENITETQVDNLQLEHSLHDIPSAIPVHPVPDLALVDLELRVSNEFAPIKEDGWDTVLYIGPPTQQHGQTQAEYDYIKHHFSRTYLMRSQTLRDSGSAEFQRRLGPMSARVARKLKNLGLHLRLPDDGTPKYWIDLRPMQNDDEALLTVAELTCTPGVLGWHKHDMARHVDPTVINGKDALNTPITSSSQLTLPPNFFSKGATTFKSGSRAGDGQKEQRINDEIEDEYSPLRHHSALERLLHAIAGHSPKLNSAPKMWTFFAVAKMFDCASHPRVSSEIYTWIFSGVNSNFIQANPEICYRIAMGTQSDQGKTLLRVAFSILVGEKALDQAMERSSPEQQLSPTTSRGRPLSHLDDDEVNRIDHAARSLNLRMQKKLDDLVKTPALWMKKSTEVFKLFALVGVDENRGQMVHAALDTLLEHTRTEIWHALSQQISLNHFVQAREDGSDYKKAGIFAPDVVKRYNAMTDSQRILSQVSWQFIRSNSILRDPSTFRNPGLRPLNGPFNISIHQSTGMFSTRAKLQDVVDLINNNIADGFVFYNGVNSHKDHLGDYEVRWDAVYAATLRNLDNISHHVSSVERTELENVADSREKLHVQKINAYEMGQRAEPYSVRQPEVNWSGVSSASASATDQYYTSAKVDVYTLLSQLSSGLSTVIESDIIRQGYLKHSSGIESEISVDSIDTLLCLDEDEFRFLPLWADGCDDGTGGVFTEAVPGAVDEDFLGGKRGLGTDYDEGVDGLEDVEMGESFSVIDTQEAESTVAGASKVATAGYGTDSVMSMDE